MEIILLIIGLILVALGIAVILSEAKARRDKQAFQARVIGFSLGKSNNPNMPSFHPVVEYVGRNGRKYFVEGTVGSSVPLQSVGQAVQVLADASDPEKAVLKSGLSYTLGCALAFFGLIAVGLFWFTFRLTTFSVVMAVVVLAGFALKIKGAWRKQPLSLEAWHAYKKKILSTRVFTEESKDQISWADPMRVASAIEGYRKSNRFAVPVLFAISLGLLFFSYHFYGRTQTFLDGADYAVGTVIELKEQYSSDSDNTYAAVVEYRDRLGRNFTFVDSFSSSPAYYQTGDTVHVLYDREDPSKAQIDRGLLNYWLTVLLGSLGALFLLMGLHSVKKRLRWSTVRTLEVQ